MGGRVDRLEGVRLRWGRVEEGDWNMDEKTAVILDK